MKRLFSSFSGGGAQQAGKGVSVEKLGKKTINLLSGRKIVIENGSIRYYSSNGEELNKKDFEKQEGKIDVKPSGRYSITKAGKTKYYAANGTELKENYFKQVENPDVVVKSNGKTYNLNKSIEKRINKVTSDLKKAEDENGFIGKGWSGFKNLTGIGDSSDKVREQQKKEQKLLAQFNSNPQRRAEIFKQLTGADYTHENLEKFINGQIKLPSELALTGYKEGQEMAVDVTADVVSGVVSFGVYTAAVAAAPFTGGASIAVGVAAAAGTGALVKTGIKYADAKSGGRDYTLKDAGHDAATGAFSGALAPVTAGAGGAVGKVVTVQAGKAGLKAGAAKAVAFTAELATDGALGGGVDNAFRTAIDGGSAEEILDAGITGAEYGAFLGPVMGWGGKGLGKTYKVTKGVLKKADDVVPTPTAKLTRAELKEEIASGQKVTQSTDIKVPKGSTRAPSTKFAATQEAYQEMLWNNANDIAFINKYVHDKEIIAKALNEIGNEGMDFRGIEHPFNIDNNMRDRGATAFDGSSAVSINTRRMGMPDEFRNDVAEMAHRVFHEKRHVYQNIQRSLGFGKAGVGMEPLQLYSEDLANGTVNKLNNTQSQFYNHVKNNGYDYKVAQDGRFPRNINEKDIEYGMNVSENQANYIESGPEYWTQFVEDDAENYVGLFVGRTVENIINCVEPSVSKTSFIAKCAYCAQELGLDFDDVFKQNPETVNEVFFKLID